ncbi:AraC family transcriptional regulator [Halalkalibacter sp. APA_J-10(15)]|uniref:AraC family transcriptional regulator n=1 Tax=unclassified Halalkalibacter TaxID=2893063 RepID=UPI001FF3ED09|nr:AraC family transcriptional regulator [Halalkalibacter sp. APA_J-10(15)]MCK0472012.1 AraC family transcriptional regulator [Halalkalibacter sp. APA_J-10(15)]
MTYMSLYNPALIQSDFYPTIVFYYYKKWHNYQMDNHSHPQVEIMYVISGECEIGFEQKRIRMKKGQFILIDSHVKHRLTVRNDQYCRMLNVEFMFSQNSVSIPSISDLATDDQYLMSFLKCARDFNVLEDSSEVYLILKSLILELDKKEKQNQVMVALYLCQLLIKIAQLDQEAKQFQSKWNHPYVKKVIHYIHHHYDCSIKVKDIADSVHLHPSYLHRIFKEYTGISIMDYLLSHRIEKAKDLLKRTDIPITEIADYVGMSSGQYFSTLFKKNVGVSPLQFRNETKQERNHSSIIS